MRSTRALHSELAHTKAWSILLFVMLGTFSCTRADRPAQQVLHTTARVGRVVSLGSVDGGLHNCSDCTPLQQACGLSWEITQLPAAGVLYHLMPAANGERECSSGQCRRGAQIELSSLRLTPGQCELLYIPPFDTENITDNFNFRSLNETTQRRSNESWVTVHVDKECTICNGTAGPGSGHCVMSAVGCEMPWVGGAGFGLNFDGKDQAFVVRLRSLPSLEWTITFWLKSLSRKIGQRLLTIKVNGNSVVRLNMNSSLGLLLGEQTTPSLYASHTTFREWRHISIAWKEVSSSVGLGVDGAWVGWTPSPSSVSSVLRSSTRTAEITWGQDPLCTTGSEAKKREEWVAAAKTQMNTTENFSEWELYSAIQAMAAAAGPAAMSNADYSLVTPGVDERQSADYHLCDCSNDCFVTASAFHGIIDDVRIYDVVRSPSELLWDMKMVLGPIGGCIGDDAACVMPSGGTGCIKRQLLCPKARSPEHHLNLRHYFTFDDYVADFQTPGLLRRNLVTVIDRVGDEGSSSALLGGGALWKSPILCPSNAPLIGSDVVYRASTNFLSTVLPLAWSWSKRKERSTVPQLFFRGEALSVSGFTSIYQVEGIPPLAVATFKTLSGEVKGISHPDGLIGVKSQPSIRVDLNNDPVTDGRPGSGDGVASGTHSGGDHFRIRISDEDFVDVDEKELLFPNVAPSDVPAYMTYNVHVLPDRIPLPPIDRVEYFDEGKPFLLLQLPVLNPDDMLVAVHLPSPPSAGQLFPVIAAPCKDLSQCNFTSSTDPSPFCYGTEYTDLGVEPGSIGRRCVITRNESFNNLNSVSQSDFSCEVGEYPYGCGHGDLDEDGCSSRPDDHLSLDGQIFHTAQGCCDGMLCYNKPVIKIEECELYVNGSLGSCITLCDGTEYTGVFPCEYHPQNTRVDGCRRGGDKLKSNEELNLDVSKPAFVSYFFVFGQEQTALFFLRAGNPVDGLAVEMAALSSTRAGVDHLVRVQNGSWSPRAVRRAQEEGNVEAVAYLQTHVRMQELKAGCNCQADDCSALTIGRPSCGCIVEALEVGTGAAVDFCGTFAQCVAFANGSQYPLVRETSPDSAFCCSWFCCCTSINYLDKDPQMCLTRGVNISRPLSSKSRIFDEEQRVVYEPPQDAYGNVTTITYQVKAKPQIPLQVVESDYCLGSSPCSPYLRTSLSGTLTLWSVNQNDPSVPNAISASVDEDSSSIIQLGGTNPDPESSNERLEFFISSWPSKGYLHQLERNETTGTYVPGEPVSKSHQLLKQWPQQVNNFTEMGREPLPDGPWSGSLRQDPTTIPLEYQSVLRATVCVQSTAIVHHAVVPQSAGGIPYEIAFPGVPCSADSEPTCIQYISLPSGLHFICNVSVEPMDCPRGEGMRPNGVNTLHICCRTRCDALPNFAMRLGYGPGCYNTTDESLCKPHWSDVQAGLKLENIASDGQFQRLVYDKTGGRFVEQCGPRGTVGAEFKYGRSVRMAGLNIQSYMPNNTVLRVLAVASVIQWRLETGKALKVHNKVSVHSTACGNGACSVRETLQYSREESSPSEVFRRSRRELREVWRGTVQELRDSVHSMHSQGPEAGKLELRLRRITDFVTSSVRVEVCGLAHHGPGLEEGGNILEGLEAVQLVGYVGSYPTGYVADVQGRLFYVPRADFYGVDSFSYKAVEADGTEGEVATVSIQVHPTADPIRPTSRQYFANADDVLALNFTGWNADRAAQNIDWLDFTGRATLSHAAGAVTIDSITVGNDRKAFLDSQNLNSLVYDAEGTAKGGGVVLSMEYRLSGLIPPFFNETQVSSGRTLELILTCSPGWFVNRMEKLCKPCSPGSYSAGGVSEQCTNCPPGYSSGGSSSSCSVCRPGTFAGRPGSSRCLSCPPGSFAAGVGMERCQECPIGHRQKDQGESSCEPCGNIAYSDLPGRGSCVDCPNNTQSLDPSSGSRMSCECMGGYYRVPSERGAACHKCPEGGYCHGRLSRPVARDGYMSMGMEEWSSNTSVSFIQCRYRSVREVCVGYPTKQVVERLEYCRFREDKECPEFPLDFSSLPDRFSEENFTCADGCCSVGYTGRQCSVCSVSFWKRFDGVCLSCEGVSDFITTVSAGVIAAAFFLVVVLSNSVKLSSFYLLTSFGQLLDLVNLTAIPWPPFVSYVMGLASIFNFNMEFVAWDCWGPAIEARAAAAQIAGDAGYGASNPQIQLIILTYVFPVMAITVGFVRYFLPFLTILYLSPFKRCYVKIKNNLRSKGKRSDGMPSGRLREAAREKNAVTAEKVSENESRPTSASSSVHPIMDNDENVTSTVGTNDGDSRPTTSLSKASSASGVIVSSGKSDKVAMLKCFDMFINFAIVVFLIFGPITGLRALQGIHCATPHTRLAYLDGLPSVTCGSSDQQLLESFGIVVLIGYVGGPSALILFLLTVARIRGTLDSGRNRSRLAFLLSRTELRFWWWELWHWLVKLSFAFAVAWFQDDVVTQIVIMSTPCILTICLIIAFRPYRKERYNLLSLLYFFSILIFMHGGLLSARDIIEAKAEEKAEGPIVWSFVGLIGACGLYTVKCIKADFTEAQLALPGFLAAVVSWIRRKRGVLMRRVRSKFKQVQHDFQIRFRGRKYKVEQLNAKRGPRFDVVSAKEEGDWTQDKFAIRRRIYYFEKLLEYEAKQDMSSGRLLPLERGLNASLRASVSMLTRECDEAYCGLYDAAGKVAAIEALREEREAELQDLQFQLDAVQQDFANMAARIDLQVRKTGMPEDFQERFAASERRRLAALAELEVLRASVAAIPGDVADASDEDVA